MIGQWMLAAIAVGVVMTVGGNSLGQLSPFFKLPRRWLVLAVMVLSVGLPAGLAFRRRVAPVPPASATVAIALAMPSVVVSASPSSSDSDSLALSTWGFASLVLAGVLATSHRRMLKQLARWQRRELLGETVVVSSDFGPAAVGLIRSQVVLPEWVFRLPLEEQRLVLQHEQQHVCSGDQFVMLAGVLMVVLMPWNPGLWWQLRRLRVAMELDCDARVALTSAERPRYARLLLRALDQQQSSHTALALLPTPSALAERVFALLESARPSRSRVALWMASAAVCAAVIGWVPVPGLAAAARAVERLATSDPVFAQPVPQEVARVARKRRVTVSGDRVVSPPIVELARQEDNVSQIVPARELPAAPTRTFVPLAPGEVRLSCRGDCLFPDSVIIVRPTIPSGRATADSAVGTQLRPDSISSQSKTGQSTTVLSVRRGGLRP